MEDFLTKALFCIIIMTDAPYSEPEIITARYIDNRIWVGRFLTVRLENHYADIDEMQFVWKTGMKSELKDLERIKARVPKEWLNHVELEKVNNNYKNHLTRLYSLGFFNSGHHQLLQEEANNLWYIHLNIKWVDNDSRPYMYRRKVLTELKELLGEEFLNSNEYIAPIPYWRLPVADKLPKIPNFENN